jgi:hypothetical protein
MIDYWQFIEALKRKPQAFKSLVFRDELFPREAYRRAWEQLESTLPQRQACQSAQSSGPIRKTPPKNRDPVPGRIIFSIWLYVNKVLLVRRLAPFVLLAQVVKQ